MGLESNKIDCKEIPAPFFRTLSFIFEVRDLLPVLSFQLATLFVRPYCLCLVQMAKMGAKYSPVTEANVKAGAPVKTWCHPLWYGTSVNRKSPAGVTEVVISESESSSSRDSSLGGASDCIDKETPINQRAENDGRDEFQMETLFELAPFWCYLYSHEPARAKKTPPKTSSQMLAVYRAGCLPEWTPVVGLSPEVSKFNSLPPSLFMTLGSLAHLVKLGSKFRSAIRVVVMS